MKSQNNQEKLLRLMEKGVKIPNPSTVLIEEDVDTERISGEGVVLYSGCKILEKGTLIMSGAKLGYEAPVTIENCQLGPDVEMKGGFFSNSVFLEKSKMGSCAHVRDACILEEEANGAHSVGTQTHYPISFCDPRKPYKFL